ncbi:DUF2892 domain-containing protein [Albimonas sp. CAU 1670]|uniref:YgaP family membrane protein n=1 Tax=Albimonas sp. CAU 1670 TaxID=3032599 RepID=UPI0023DB5395|nr:DUF2892 domain-containing protein [Albimonas sp. CAU 1670]MDF2234698.1 DUF2892 domain-containing protein [Albimonas sp. CAU 1670]
MTCNVGPLDRTIRFILSVFLLALAYITLEGAWAWAALAVGLVMLATAAARFCPLYLPFRFRT